MKRAAEITVILLCIILSLFMTVTVMADSGNGGEQALIKVESDKTDISVGETITLKASFLNKLKKNNPVTWSTSDPGVASVDSETGVVTAVSAGTATITATSKNNPAAQGSITITVIPAEPSDTTNTEKLPDPPFADVTDEETEADETTAEEEPSGPKKLLDIFMTFIKWVGIIILAVILIVAGIFVYLILSPRRGQICTVKRRVTRANKDGVQLRLVFYTINSSQKCTLCLTDTISIGTDKHCDIRLQDNVVSPFHATIFLRDREVYIRDNQTNIGTRIGGMRIFEDNILRNNDEIEIGNTWAKIYFKENML